jgi:hypothetical protein
MVEWRGGCRHLPCKRCVWEWHLKCFTKCYSSCGCLVAWNCLLDSLKYLTSAWPVSARWNTDCQLTSSRPGAAGSVCKSGSCVYVYACGVFACVLYVPVFVMEQWGWMSAELWTSVKYQSLA